MLDVVLEEVKGVPALELLEGRFEACNAPAVHHEEGREDLAAHAAADLEDVRPLVEESLDVLVADDGVQGRADVRLGALVETEVEVLACEGLPVVVHDLDQDLEFLRGDSGLDFDALALLSLLLLGRLAPLDHCEAFLVDRGLLGGQGLVVRGRDVDVGDRGRLDDELAQRAGAHGLCDAGHLLGQLVKQGRRVAASGILHSAGRMAASLICRDWAHLSGV